MAKQSEQFCRRLLACESWESPLHAKYDSLIQDLLAGKLTLVQRWSFILTSVAAVLSAALFAWVAVTQADLPPVIRLFLLEGVVICGVWIGYCATLLRRGIFHRQRQPVFISSLVWVTGILISTNFLVAAGLSADARIAVLFVGIGVITLIGAGIGLLRTCIEQSELNTNERMLQIQFQLADFTEKLGAREGQNN